MYIEVHNDTDKNKIKEILESSDIKVYDIFDDIYEKMCEENIRYYMLNLIPDKGILRDEESENYILDADDETFNNIIKESTKAMYDNEYLYEVVCECTVDAIESGLRELFIKAE